jgi:hypothetical protein
MCFESVSILAAFTFAFVTVQLPVVAIVRKLCFPLFHAASQNAIP